MIRHMCFTTIKTWGAGRTDEVESRKDESVSVVGDFATGLLTAGRTQTDSQQAREDLRYTVNTLHNCTLSVIFSVLRDHILGHKISLELM